MGAMVTPGQAGFDPRTTFLFLEDGGDTVSVDVTPTFWRELSTGETTSAAIRRIRERDGRLLVIVPQEASAPHREMHPGGEEVLYLLSGAVDVVLEEGGGDRVVELRPGSACLVPRGVWHRLIVHQPGELLAITYGKGTEHRPL
jgi:mannose-6-phosphate isomerase-like protein (cupin superfamily)